MGDKIAIVGSREYPVLEEVQTFVKQLPLDAIIISGGAHDFCKTAYIACFCGALNTVSVIQITVAIEKRIRNKEVNNGSIT